MAVDPRRAEAGLAELVALYRDAQRIIALQVKEAISNSRITQAAFRVQAFRLVDAELTRLGIEGDRLAKRLIENAWTEGDASVTRAIGDGTFQFSQLNRGALTELQQALVDSLDGARRTIGRQVMDVYRKAGLRATTLGMLGAEGSGRKVAASLVEQLREQGVNAFVDRVGRAWKLEDYASMVARTTTREAVVQAQIQRMAEQGIEYARVSTSSRPCSICARWQGVLVSLGAAAGKLKGEPATTLDALPAGGPPFHANCRHYLTPEATDFADFIEKRGGGDGGGQEPPAGGSGSGSGAGGDKARRFGEWKQRVTPDARFGRAARADIDRGLRAISSVHGPRGIPAMRLQTETVQRFGGWFERGTQNMAINPSWADRAFALVHEIGHVVDFYEIGTGVVGSDSIAAFGSEGGAWASGVVDAALRSETVALLKQIQGGLDAGNRFREHANYLLRRREIFARAYAQYIATKSGDKVIQEAMRRYADRGTLNGFMHWPPDDFKEIEAAFDEAFGT